MSGSMHTPVLAYLLRYRRGTGTVEDGVTEFVFVAFAFFHHLMNLFTLTPKSAADLL